MAEWKTETITLLHPIKVGELSLAEFVLKEPDVEALEKMEDAGFVEGVTPSTKQIRLAIEAMSGQPTEIVVRLHKDDFRAIGEKIIPLLTGASDSEKGSDSTVESSGTSQAT